MAMSYHRILGDHLADHLIYLSSSSSFWFSLNSSYDHEFHLSKRLDTSPQDYEYLLMALDLARMDKRWGFSIMVM
jgi:MoaA/NifB/PqqE/SkfB family radical SAM enzyme